MSNLVILSGIPGCGKSTWAKTLLGNGHYAVISSDEIRERILGDEKDQTGNERVFATFHREIEERLAHGIDVVADSTALDRFARNNLRVIAERQRAKTHLVLFKNVGEAIERNAKRERVVPDDAMNRMLIKYGKTLTDITFEKYDKVTEVDSVA